MAYDDSVFWFMESSFPLYCKGQLISLSPGWRPFIMPADTYLLPVVRVHSRKWAQQTGCGGGRRRRRGGQDLKYYCVEFPVSQVLGIPDQRTLQAESGMKENTEITPEAIPISG